MKKYFWKNKFFSVGIIVFLMLFINACNRSTGPTESTSNCPTATAITYTGTYEENFESFSGLSSEGWVSPAGVTGIIQIISDPTGSGRNNVLELQDTITTNGDIGAVVYSPVIDALKTANLTTNAIKTTILLDFYFADSVGRWFVIGKTSHESFVMNDPSSQVDAYENFHHSYIPVVRNKWYSLKIIINNTPGTYDVEVTDPETSTVIGTITGKAFDTGDNYDSMHFSSCDSSDGRLMFGSWFSYTGCPDNSYGHVYIDNIKVETEI